MVVVCAAPRGFVGRGFGLNGAATRALHAGVSRSGGSGPGLARLLNFSSRFLPALGGRLCIFFSFGFS